MTAAIINKRVYRPPRILSLVLLFFMLLLSLDVFGPDYTRQEMFVGFLMHNIPTIALGVVIFFARKNEMIGAIAFAILGVLYMGFVARSIYNSGFEWYLLAWTIEISGILFVTSRLFRRGWKQKINK